jgi:hypothetical protein
MQVNGDGSGGEQPHLSISESSNSAAAKNH